jgi:GPH family glycoside/pentoside/hexuronide:cation symporter
MQMRHKIGYAMGDLGISISYFAVGFFFIYYLTDVVGLDPYLAGLAFFLGKLWDGVNDPIMGVLSDRTRSRFGRKRVYVLFGAVPLALSFMLLWAIPTDAAQWVQFVLATLAITLFATTYSVVVVPYMALVPIMSRDYDERTQITGIRAILSTIGTIAGGATAMLLSSFDDEVIGIRTITLAFAIVTSITLIVAAMSVRDIEDNPSANGEIMPFEWGRYLAIMTDRNVAVLLLHRLLGAIGTGVMMASIPYFADNILGDPGKSTIGIAIYVAMSALTIPIWTRLTHVHDKRRLLLVSNILTAMVLCGTGFLVGAGQSQAFYVGCFFLGLTMSAYILIPYSLVPDLVEYYENETGERHESIFFGLWITSHQLGISGTGLIIGLSLGLFGYDGTVDVQTDQALMAVRVSLGVIPGVFLIIAALVLQKYTVTREVFETISSRPPDRDDMARDATTS